MAQALRPGGLYKMGDTFVDAEGKTVDAAEAQKALASRDGAAASDEGDEFEGMTKDELVAAAEKRGLTVTRSDGKDGAPLADDYRAALRA